jgi:cbb3-type cytochrome oxidase maturation protein
MSLMVLIPLSLCMGAIGLGAFLWALRHDQFDDPEGAAWRVIPADGDRDEPAQPKE